MVDEQQDNKKLKVGAVRSLPSGDTAGFQRTATDPARCGPDAGDPGLGSDLGSSWERCQGEPGKEPEGLSPPGGLGGGASLGAKSRMSLLTACVSLGLGFCISKMTGLDKLKSHFVDPTLYD